MLDELYPFDRNHQRYNADWIYRFICQINRNDDVSELSGLGMRCRRSTNIMKNLSLIADKMGFVVDKDMGSITESGLLVIRYRDYAGSFMRNNLVVSNVISGKYDVVSVKSLHEPDSVVMIFGDGEAYLFDYLCYGGVCVLMREQYY